MKRILLHVLALAAFQCSAYAMERAQGWCEKGGQPVVTQGLNSIGVYQQSYPQCTVSVYVTNSGGTLATIYSDNVGTMMSNPFTADTTGHYAFYAANGHNDIQISGAGLSAPYTFGDVLFFDFSPFVLPVSGSGCWSSGVSGQITLVSCTPGGPTDSLQFNNGSMGFGGSGNLGWNNSAQQLQVFGVTNTAAIFTTGGFIYAGGGVQSALGTYQGYSSTTDGAVLRGLSVPQNIAGTAGGYIDLTPMTYNPYDGSTCTDVYGNVVQQPVPLSGGTFGANDALIWLTLSPTIRGDGSCGVPLPVNAAYNGDPNNVYGLATNTYWFARGGFATDNPEWNAIWALPVAGTGSNKIGGGGIAGNSIALINYTQTGNNALAASQTGPPPLTLNDAIHPGAMYFDFSASCEKLFSGPYSPGTGNTVGSWACIGSGGGGTGTPGGPGASVQFNNSGSFGGSANLTWNNGTQLLDITAASSADAGLLVTVGFIQSDLGLVAVNNAVPTTALPFNVIQAPHGGMEALSFSAANYVQTGSYTGSAPSAPTLDDSFHAGALSWSVANTCEAVYNGSAWVCVGSGGGSTTPGGANTNVQFNSSGSFAGSGNFVWNNTGQALTVTALAAGDAGIAVGTGFIQADQGFLATSGVANKYNVIQAPTGGMEALSFTASGYVQTGSYSGSAPTVTTSDTFNAGALSWSVTSSCETVYTGSAWTCLAGGGGGGSPGGPSTAIQFNNSGAFGGSGALVWSGTQVQVDTGSTASQVRLSSGASGTDSGMYLTATGTSVGFISAGAAYNGSNFIAKDTAAGLFGLSGTSLNLYLNSGLSIGSSYSPSLAMTLAPSGETLTGSITATGGNFTSGGVVVTSNTSTSSILTSGGFTSSLTGGAVALQVGGGNMQVNGNGFISALNLEINGGSGAIGVSTNTALNSIETVGGIASITTAFGSGGGNCSIQDKSSFSALNNCTAGATIFALAASGASSPYGVFRLSNGTGSGQLDGDGATIYGLANTGVLEDTGGFAAVGCVSYNCIQVPNSGSSAFTGGMAALSFTGFSYVQTGSYFSTSASVGPPATTSDTLHNGSMSFNTNFGQETVLTASGWSIIGSMQAGVPNVGGTGCSLQSGSNNSRGLVVSGSSSTVCSLVFSPTLSVIPWCNVSILSGNGSFSAIGTTGFLVILPTGGDAYYRCEQ
jgi:hypothetical protein